MGDRLNPGERVCSEQMYKKRLRKWNIRKRTYRKTRDPSSGASARSTSPSAAAATTTAAAAAAAGDSEPSPVGVVVAVEELPLRTRKPAERGRRSPPDNAALSLVRLSSAEPFAGLEVVLNSASAWGQGKLEASDAVLTDPMSRYLAAPNAPPIQDSRTMYRTFELVFDLWRRGRGDLAGMAARKGFYVLEYVLTEDHPDLVWHMLDTIYDMVTREHLDLLRLFLDHASALSRRLLPALHPLVLILAQLRRCDYQTPEGRQHIAHLLRTAWLRNVDVLGDRIGSLAPAHLWLYEQLIWDGRTRLRKDSELWRRREAIGDALARLSTTTRPDAEADRLRVQALMLEFTQMDLGDKVQAERLARELLDTTEDASSSSSSSSSSTDVARSHDRFHAYARKMLARLHADRSDWGPAEDNLRLAVSRREMAHGTGDNIRVVRDMWVLAEHYHQVGRLEDADAVIQDAIGRAQRYLEDVPG